MGAKAVFASQPLALWLTQSLADATGLIVLRHNSKTNSTIKLLECMIFNGKTGMGNRADNIRIIIQHLKIRCDAWIADSEIRNCPGDRLISPRNHLLKYLALT